MNKKVIINICVGILIVVSSIIAWHFTHLKFDKSNPILFKQQENDDYAYIIYQGREYVPYSAINPNRREKYLGYVGDDKQEEIYTFQGHSEEEWLISYLDSGMMNDCMLLKEKSVAEIPEGLSSEYEWNQ